MDSQIIKKPQTLKEILGDPKYKSRIDELMKERAHTFILSLLSLVNGNPQLSECEPVSLLNAALTSASLNLPMNPNLGYAYPVPYRDKKGILRAQFQIGAKGFIQLALRTKLVKTINITTVKEGEVKGFNRMTGEIEFQWIQDTDERNKLKTIGYLSYLRLHDGFEKTLYMTNEEMDQHASKYSQSYKQKKGLWIDDFETMGEKTIGKLMISKWGPTSTDIETARLADQAVIEEEGVFKYVDREKETPQDMASRKERLRIIDHINTSKTVNELSQVCQYIEPEDTELVTLYNSKEQTLK